MSHVDFFQFNSCFSLNRVLFPSCFLSCFVFRVSCFLVVLCLCYMSTLFTYIFTCFKKVQTFHDESLLMRKENGFW